MMRLIFGLALGASFVFAQPKVGVPYGPLGDGPWVFDTAEQHKVKVTLITKALNRPFGMVFLPGGDILVTERGGQLRIVRDGVLDPKPLTGIPKVNTKANSGLFDVILHPKFAQNKLVYFAYSKPAENGMATSVLARGRLEAGGLVEVKDLYSTEPSVLAGGSRLVFAGDGTIYMTTPSATGVTSNLEGNMAAQNPMSGFGKVLRLKEDGTIPSDNPFVGKSGYRPEIYSMGHRDHLGLVMHPSGAIFNVEHGPNGGDEVNLIKAGLNYGWPLVSFGRWYDGARVSAVPHRDGFELPQVVWIPSIGPSGLMFYTGDKFPQWKGNLFTGSARYGEVPGTGHLERVVLNDKFEDVRREMMLTELHQRFRDVRQGPDGFIYALTDQEVGALLRIEPAQ